MMRVINEVDWRENWIQRGRKRPSGIYRVINSIMWIGMVWGLKEIKKR